MDARKKVLYSATSILLSITTVLSILFTLFPIQASGDVLPDFSQFVTSYTLTVKDSHDNITDSAHFDKDSANVTLPAVQIGDGTKVAFSMTFALADIESAPAGSGDHVAGNSYAMSLPAAFIPQDVGSTAIKINPGDGPVTIGSWSLKSGVLTVTFNSNADGYISRQGYFNISSTFSANQLVSDSGGVIPFRIGAATVNLPVQVTAPQVKPTVSKTGTYSGGTITWTVTVSSGNDGFNGGLTDVTVIDTLSGNQTFWDSAAPTFDGTVLVKDSDIAPGYRVSGSDTVTFHLGNMAHNQTKQLIYTTHANDLNEKPIFPNTAVQYTNTAVLGANEIVLDPPTASYTVKNSASASSWITKTGSTATLDSGGRPASFQWKIAVNPGGKGVIPAGAVVKDVLPQYLSRDTGVDITIGTNSIGTAVSDTDPYYSISTSADGKNIQTLTVTFPKELTTEQDLSFNTLVDPAYYNKYNPAFSNTATLSQGGTTVSSNQVTGVGTGSSVISKTRVSYNAATHLATWNITVNSNRIALTNPVVTDTIDPRGGQVFDSISAATLSGSAISLSPAASISAMTDNQYYASSDGKTVTVDLSDFADGAEPVVLTVATKVNDPNYFGVNSSSTVYNSASLVTGNGISDSSSTSQSVASTVIGKTGDYNYSTKTFTWKVTVNQNQMPMTHAVVTDPLPADVTFQGITLADGNNTGITIHGNSGPVPYYTLVGQTLTVYLDDLGTSTDLGTKAAQRIITVTATMSDAVLAGKNLSFSEQNTTSVHFDSGPTSDPNSSYTQSVSQSIVEKSGSYNSATNQADWKVLINKNQASASALGISSGTAVSLNDTLPDGLVLDPTSVKLFNLSWATTNGSWTKGTEIPLTISDSVQYNPATRLFTFTFPSGTDFSKAYELDFSTDVTKGGNYTNSITMDGMTKDQSGQSTGFTVSQSNVDAGFSGALRGGSAAVTKLDADTGLPVPGTTFALCQSGIPIQTGVTNAQGKITFSSLKQNQTYTVKETVPASGYQSNSTQWTFTVTSSALNPSYTFTDEKTPASSQASSSSQPESSSQASSSSQPVSSLVPSSAAPSQSHSGGSGSGGTASDSSQEPSLSSAASSAPGGSSGSKPTVTSGSQGVGGWSASAGGAIYIKKADADGNALSGAEFTLSDAAGTFLSKKVTGTNGVLTFRNLKPGDYSVKETKAPKGYERYDSPLAVTLTDGQEAGYTLKDGLKGSPSSEVLGWSSDNTLPKTGETPIAPFLLAGGVLLMLGGLVARRTESGGRKMRRRR